MVGSKDGGLSPSGVEFIAGLLGGAVSTLTLHPLDLAKTRMQSTEARLFLTIMSRSWANPVSRLPGPRRKCAEQTS